MAGGGSGYTKSGTTTLPLMPGLDEHDATSMYGVSVFPNMFLDLTGTGRDRDPAAAARA